MLCCNLGSISDTFLEVSAILHLNTLNVLHPALFVTKTLSHREGW